MISNIITRLSNWLIRRYGTLEIIQLILLLFSTCSAALGLAAVVSRLDSGFMLGIAIISTWIAWILSRTHLPNWAFAMVGSLSGLAWLIFTVGGLGRSVASLTFSIFPLIAQWLQSKMIDTSETIAAWQSTGETITALVARITNWFQNIRLDGSLIDPMVTSIFWGFTLWLTTFWALWWVRKRTSVLPGLIPIIAILGYITYYLNSKIGIFWLVIITGELFILQGFIHYASSSHRWRIHHLAQVEIEPELAVSVILLATIMILSGGSLPSISFHRIAESIEKVFHPSPDTELAESLGLEKPPDSTSITKTGIYPTKNHDIGPGPDLTEDVVMHISVDHYHPTPYQSVNSKSINRFYWRAQIFGEFTGQTWLSNTGKLTLIPADQSLIPDLEITNLPEQNPLVTQHVTNFQKTEQNVFGAGELLTLDQSSYVARDSSGEIVYVLSETNSYTAVSRTTSPSVDELYSAGMNYPDSLDRYLEIPQELPSRVIDLALDLTATQPMPYDRAKVLETYLRQFPYSLDVPAPPADRDAVDYFLFDLKTGYCDYYASAMVIMARAVGIPARLVTGYTEGDYDQDNGYFVVRANNAHAWPELYFPEIGWVQFEPTPSQPVNFRPDQPVDIEPIINPYTQHKWQLSLILKFIPPVIVILSLLLMPIERWRLSLMPTDQALARIFHQLYQHGNFLGITTDPSRTPNEFASDFSAALEGLSTNERQSVKVAKLRANLNELTSLYNIHLFSGHPVSGSAKQTAIQTWASIRNTLKRIRWSKLLSRLIILIGIG